MKFRQVVLLGLSGLAALSLQSCGGDSSEHAVEQNQTALGAAAGTGTAATLPVVAAYDPESSTYQDLQGRGLELDSFAGKRVFINYWATWCAPCIREIPSLNRAAAALADENYLFLLASDESIETIKEFIAERGFGGHYIKLNTFFGAHGIDAVPSSMLYDENGELLAHWAGAYEWDSSEMLSEIRNAASTTQ